MKQTKSFVSEKLNGNNLFLYITTIATAIVDILLAVILLVGGKLDLVFALALLDVLLVVTVFNSNFRFRYSLLAPILYLIACAGLCFAISFSSFAIITNASLIWFIALHILPAIALITNVVTIARVGTKFKLLPCILSLLTAVGSIAYVVVALTSGFFGQGSFGYRNIYFYYDNEADYYVAQEVIDGFGTKLTIPESFNGKKVGAIDGNILSTSGLKEIYFNVPADVKIINSNEITNVDDDCKLFIDKTQIDDFRERMVSLSIANPTGTNAYLSLMNATVPVNLSNGERYLTFDYTATSLQQADYQILKTWIAPSSKAFDLSVVGEGIDYAENFDIDDESFLYATYTRNDMIVCFNTDKGSVIDSGDITTENNLVVSFDKVYRLSVGNDNDTLYETDSTFKSFNGSGYRYILGSDHKDLLSTIQLRNGFDLSWEYTSNTHSSKTPLTSLSSVIEQQNLTVYPKWTLRAPVISSLTKDKAGNYVYGEDVTFTATATAPSQDLSLKYEWQKDGGSWSSAYDVKTYSKTNLFPNDSGTYNVKVTTYSNTVTSLTSTAEYSISLTVDKKALGIQWSLPDEIYSGTTKPVSAQRVEEDVINNDDVTVLLDVTSIRNVGNYTFKATLSGATADLYQLEENSKSFTLKPYNITSGVNWENLSFTYDGEQHLPSASVLGIGDESSSLITLSVNGGKVNAGTYTSTATITDSNYKTNYTIDSSVNKTQFTIEKLVVTPQSSNTSLVYIGTAQAPEFTVQGVSKDGVITLSVSGLKTYANNAQEPEYTATLSLPTVIHKQNYELSSATAQFTISKAQVSVSWNNPSLTYNGNEQSPTPSAKGVKNESISLAISGKQTNAGSGYTATASISSASQQRNYDLIASSISKSFSIAKKEVTTLWTNTSLVYNKQTQLPTAKVKLLDKDGGTISLTVSGDSATNVGSYQASTSLPVDSTSNYTLLETTSLFNITPATAIVSWGQTTFTYNGLSQLPTATASGVGSESVVINVSGAKTNAGKHQATATTSNGNYVLSNASVEFTIEKAVLTLTWSITNQFDFDGTPKTVEVLNIDGTVNSDLVPITYTYYTSNNIPLSSAPTEAGNYKVVVTTSNPNYVISNATTTFTIVSTQA